MNQINGNEFSKKLSDSFALADLLVTEDIMWRLDGVERTFDNCEFKNWIFDTKAHKIVFNNCSFKTLQIQWRSELQSLEINNCLVNTLILKGAGKHYLESIKITGSETSIENLKIEGDFIADKILLEGIQGVKKANLKIDCDTIDFQNVANLDYLFLYGEVRKELRINNCKDLDFFAVNDLKAQRIEITESSKLDIQFDLVEAKYINFNRCTDVTLETTYLKADHVGLNEGSFKKITLYHECNINLKSSSIQNPLTIDELIMRGTKISKDNVLNFDGVTFGVVTFSGLHNNGLIQMLNCDIGKSLELFESNLGKLQLTNVKTTSNCRIDILDSNIDDVLFNSFRWENNYRLFENYDAWILVRYKTELNFLYSLRESYRQLKANYQKAGNKIESLEFQKRELDIHHRILSLFKFESSRNLGNFLVVATNKWFSDFGQNIWKPVVWLLAVHIVIFNAIIFSYDLGISHVTSINQIDWDATWAGINLFFQTLLPTHSATVNGFYGNELSIAGLFDSLDRILSGYFIFYFISASRKYHQ